VWVAGGTLDALGLQPSQDVSHDQRVPLAVLTRDIQFRGAISDFHAHRALIKAADYDPLVLRSNPDNTYGDGNNFEARPRLRTDRSLRTANMEMLHLTCSLHKALSRAAGGNKGCRRPVGCCSRRGSFAAAGQGRGGCGGGPRTRRAATQASRAAAQALDVPGAHPGVDGPACTQASGCKRLRQAEYRKRLPIHPVWAGCYRAAMRRCERAPCASLARARGSVRSARGGILGGPAHLPICRPRRSGTRPACRASRRSTWAHSCSAGRWMLRFRRALAHLAGPRVHASAWWHDPDLFPSASALLASPTYTHVNVTS